MKKVILTAIIILSIVCVATIAIVLVKRSHKRKTPDTLDGDNTKESSLPTQEDPEWQQKPGVLYYNDVQKPDIPITLFFKCEKYHNEFCTMPFFAVLDLFDIQYTPVGENRVSITDLQGEEWILDLSQKTLYNEKEPVGGEPVMQTDAFLVGVVTFGDAPRPVPDHVFYVDGSELYLESNRMQGALVCMGINCEIVQSFDDGEVRIQYPR